MPSVTATILNVEHREGVGKKTGKEYSFYQAHVLDKQFKVHVFNFSKKLEDDADQLEKVIPMKNEEVQLVLDISPKGAFDTAVTIVSVE